MEIEQAQEKAKKIEEIQNLMMENLASEALKHDNENLAKIIREEIHNTEGQRMLIDLNKILFEPLMDNRFIVSFPDEFNISPYTVDSITMPIIERRKCSDTIIVFKKLSALVSKAIVGMASKKNFKIKVEQLNATGTVIETWDILVKRIYSVDFGGEMNYSNDSISKIKVIFKTKDCILRTY
jgi:hypothetical protein